MVDAPGASRKGLGKGRSQRQGEGKEWLAGGGDRNVHLGVVGVGRGQAGLPGLKSQVSVILICLHLDYSAAQRGLSSQS